MMAKKRASLSMPAYGGHDCTFVAAVPDRLNCNICTKVLRDPHLAVCCGQHFCESCLNKWFTGQGKESCPHCRAEGEAFKYVINKGLRSEINQLKIRCSNHGKGCQWTGELGELKPHLGSDNGCDFVMVNCPNKCKGHKIKRKDLVNHLTHSCHLRPYRCEFCGLKDTYTAIRGYDGHQARCPEVLLTCPNKCGQDKIKRKDMVNHRTQCPQEPVRCPFAEAGCSIAIRRHWLKDHMTSNQQQHLLMVMNDNKKTKAELHRVKLENQEMKKKLYEAEAKLAMAEDRLVSFSRLEKEGDFIRVYMPKFSEYRCSGKVWHSPPFYYREGYKMCLAVYANGVGRGAGTHVSVGIFHIKGEYDYKLKWPLIQKRSHERELPQSQEGCCWFLVSSLRNCLNISQQAQVGLQDKFCHLNERALTCDLVNDCLSLSVEFNGFGLIVQIV